MARTAETLRRTNETDIAVKLDIDGRGEAKLDYPVGFMTHMLATFARHSLFDIEIRARGDLETDQHHLVEDTGITLGQCLSDALGERRGIRRSGSCFFPMDETLARAAVDISGRPFLVFDVPLSGVPLVSVSGGASSSFQVDTVEDFWRGFVTAAGITFHLDILRGRSDHHKIEALFKAAACALREACGNDPRRADIVPSTKGTLA
ncbi:MAG: imidazoleglycerol-phosphate dehydratase HisB [Treponema sp.]|jgi:imidazoleglycerol-phosphate dehydratase|nr:imidazoleglycerol-phosphate dehydratase HisB [Treponema sp.]